MTFGIVIRILVLCCLVGPNLTMPAASDRKRKCGGFTVRKAETTLTTQPQRLKFQDVLTNLGGWSTATNEFVSPCTGAYFFTFSVLSPKDGDFQLALVKGDQCQVMAYGSKSGYQEGSNSALLVLEIGDRIHLELKHGTIYKDDENEFYNDFTGHLVDEF